MRLRPLICVRDVEASSRWYQRLLNCESAHGGPNYERLVRSDELVLQLHRWEVEHHHGPIGDPADTPPGNGLLLWFEVDDFDAAIKRAETMGADVILPRHRAPLDGDGGPNQNMSLRAASHGLTGCDSLAKLLPQHLHRRRRPLEAKWQADQTLAFSSRNPAALLHPRVSASCGVGRRLTQPRNSLPISMHEASGRTCRHC